MVKECKEYLINKLKESGIKNKPFTTMKELKQFQDSHVGAVLFEKDEFEKEMRKAIFTDENGIKHKKRKTLKRTTLFSVIIGEYTQDKCEEIFDNFMKSLDQGINIDNAYVEINPQKADWVDEKDSVLKAKVAVQVVIEFEGGIYKDSGYKRINNIDFEISKEG